MANICRECQTASNRGHKLPLPRLPGFAISFLANSICTIKTLNGFKHRMRQSAQNKQTPSTKKAEWNHTLRPISTCKAQIHDDRRYCLYIDTIHVHKRKRLIPPSNVRKTITNLLLAFRTTQSLHQQLMHHAELQFVAAGVLVGATC